MIGENDGEVEHHHQWLMISAACRRVAYHSYSRLNEVSPVENGTILLTVKGWPAWLIGATVSESCCSRRLCVTRLIMYGLHPIPTGQKPGDLTARSMRLYHDTSHKTRKIEDFIEVLLG